MFWEIVKENLCPSPGTVPECAESIGGALLGPMPLQTERTWLHAAYVWLCRESDSNMVSVRRCSFKIWAVTARPSCAGYVQGTKLDVFLPYNRITFTFCTSAPGLIPRNPIGTKESKAFTQGQSKAQAVHGHLYSWVGTKQGWWGWCDPYELWDSEHICDPNILHIYI